MHRILLSIPHVGVEEQEFVRLAFSTNWISTVGPNVTAFEQEFESRIGLPSVSVSSGTAAIHLGLQLLGVGPGDLVFCSTLTFVATANPIRYQGAEPVFIDSEAASWNLDPSLLANAMRQYASRNQLPKAVVVVDLYGQCADFDPILAVCREYGVPVLEDAAEAVGSTYKGKSAGTLGDVGAFSFAGNKIITTSGGGMLASSNPDWVRRARFLASQSRDPGIGYEHSEIGYNNAMSNVLAGIGRGQLQKLDDRIERRRAIAFRYRDAFADIPGISLMPQCDYGLHTNWLSCFLLDPARFGADRDQLMTALDRAGIESRPVWKPMHLQRLYQCSARIGGEVAEGLFRNGICLPSCSSMPEEDQQRVIDAVRATHAARRR